MKHLQKMKDRPIASASMLVSLGVAINAAWYWIDPTAIDQDTLLWLAKTATVFSLSCAALLTCDIFDIE